MVRLESDLAQVLLAACRGELSEVSLSWSPGSAMVVVMASKGYPGSYEKGTVIQNLEEAENVADERFSISNMYVCSFSSFAISNCCHFILK